MPNQDPEAKLGLYKKYDVKRRNDPAGKHHACQFYVLDLNHDRFAVAALKAYAVACRDDYPELARDLWTRLDAMQTLAEPLPSLIDVLTTEKPHDH